MPIQDDEEETPENRLQKNALFAAIICFVWVFVPLVKNSRASYLNLMTKVIAFVMLASCSIIWSSMNYSINLPSFWPETMAGIDSTFGFLTSYFVLPLLIIAEDRRDYSSPHTSSPANSTTSYTLFLYISGFVRYGIAMLLCLTIAASATNYIEIDPFMVLLMCIFTITSVSSKMTAYLYKFTNSHFIALILPCVISVVQVICSNGNIGMVNTVANYIAEFFAYQFLAIIPFGLWYLRSAQLTMASESSEGIVTDPQADDGA